MGHMQESKHEAGTKYDAEKARLDLVPPEAELAVGEVFAYGARLYGDRNWEKGMSWGRNIAAARRHIAKFMRGEEDDDESGLPHLAHAIVDLMFVLAYDIRGTGTDDRGLVSYQDGYVSVSATTPTGTIPYTETIQDVAVGTERAPMLDILLGLGQRWPAYKEPNGSGFYGEHKECLDKTTGEWKEMK